MTWNFATNLNKHTSLKCWFEADHVLSECWYNQTESAVTQRYVALKIVWTAKMRQTVCFAMWISQPHIILILICGYLSVGQLNNGKWPACFARTVCLRIGPFRTGLAGTRVCSFDLAEEARHRIGKICTWCPFAKTTANCSNFFSHFHLISFVSRPQRPLVD